MPLIQSSSKEALQKNISKEIKAGKDPKQAVAIAYSVQKENDNTIKDIADFSVEYTYDGDSTSDYIGHLNVKATSATEALIKAKKYAMSEFPETNPRNFVITSTKYTNAKQIDKDIKDESLKIPDIKYHIKDSKKSFIIKYKDKNYIVKAKDSKQAAIKLNKKLNDSLSQVKSTLYKISKMYSNDPGIELVLNALKNIGYDATVENIDGWKKSNGSGEQIKEYILQFEDNGKEHHILVQLYADDNDWKVKEINAYTTD